MHLTRRRQMIVTFIMAALFTTGRGTVHAIAPSYISDEELAKYPNIVIAKWTKKEFKTNHRVEGNVLKEWEAKTEIEIESVIKGDLKPGKYTIMTAAFIGWDQNNRIMTFTSTELPGDVSDVTKPNLWFLTTTHSWDTTDKTDYLFLDHYRGVQPLALEKFFKALNSKESPRDLEKLYDSDEPEVLTRLMRHACGGTWPWPQDSEFERRYLSPGKEQEVLKDQAEAIANLLDRKLPNFRHIAASVYAELKGRRCIEKMRKWLGDEDPKVRAVAVGILAHLKDEESIDKMNLATQGIDGQLACKTIHAIGKWGNWRTAPALMRLLENDTYAGCVGEDLIIPAFQARKELHTLTDHWFPYDVKASLKAWDEAKLIEEKEGRKKCLEKALPGDEFPLRAEFVSAENTTSIRITNQSEADITISERPCYVNFQWPSGVSSYSLTKDDKNGYVTLASGKSVECEISLKESFLRGDPQQRNALVEYRALPMKAEQRGWIGVLKIEFGKNWKEPERIVKRVEEKWPNGNLKKCGDVLNGKETGLWTFYNEQGDRIKEINYTTGLVAECNPTHPDNKGAGLAKKDGENKGK